MSRTRDKNDDARGRAARARAAAGARRRRRARARAAAGARASIRFGRPGCDGRAQELMLLTRSAIIRAENLPS